MKKDERDLLDVLKFELEFLQDGGYGRSPKRPRKQLYIFEDSPTCMNFNSRDDRRPCSDCVLIDLVSPELRATEIPCRHIALNACGDTLDSLYGKGNQYEIEEAAEKWLRSAIQQLEEERAGTRANCQKQPLAAREKLRGTPLYQSTRSKCANPVCPTTFHWTGGGKFFRFRPDPGFAGAGTSPDAAAGIHGLKHYWLCERCSHMFTLIYDEQYGVVLQAVVCDLPATEFGPQKQRDLSRV